MWHEIWYPKVNRKCFELRDQEIWNEEKINSSRFFEGSNQYIDPLYNSGIEASLQKTFFKKFSEYSQIVSLKLESFDFCWYYSMRNFVHIISESFIINDLTWNQWNCLNIFSKENFLIFNIIFPYQQCFQFSKKKLILPFSHPGIWQILL